MRYWEGTDPEGRADAIDRYLAYQALDEDNRIGSANRYVLFIGLAPQLPGGILLVDEPELHLHPTAVEDVTDWLRQRSADGQSLVVATHSPTVMRLATPAPS